ncbi:hypothetical protein [Streptomyces atratus]|uniref:hypothetical protein n=1 Tax=Streptomyces atratus TaxID=1893 RepID=UPI00366268FC
MEAEDFWLEYVDARGESRGGPLEVMWRARFEAAGQVRAFPSYRGQRNFPGWYWAATSTELVGYESWVELSHLMRLDADPETQRPETERRVAHLTGFTQIEFEQAFHLDHRPRSITLRWPRNGLVGLVEAVADLTHDGAPEDASS